MNNEELNELINEDFAKRWKRAEEELLPIVRVWKEDVRNIFAKYPAEIDIYRAKLDFFFTQMLTSAYNEAERENLLDE